MSDYIVKIYESFDWKLKELTTIEIDEQNIKKAKKVAGQKVLEYLRSHTKIEGGKVRTSGTWKPEIPPPPHHPPQTA